MQSFGYITSAIFAVVVNFYGLIFVSFLLLSLLRSEAEIIYGHRGHCVRNWAIDTVLLAIFDNIG